MSEDSKKERLTNLDRYLIATALWLTVVRTAIPASLRTPSTTGSALTPSSLKAVILSVPARVRLLNTGPTGA